MNWYATKKHKSSQFTYYWLQHEFVCCSNFNHTVLYFGLQYSINNYIKNETIAKCSTFLIKSSEEVQFNCLVLANVRIVCWIKFSAKDVAELFIK
ncbi:hypothetical protein TW84_07835 [Vibrio neptunius]|nr:hypothetical protein TW84_07835 [Vibrio neptunius]